MAKRIFGFLWMLAGAIKHSFPGFLLVAFFFGCTAWLYVTYATDPKAYGGLLTYMAISGLFGVYYFIKTMQTLIDHIWWEW